VSLDGGSATREVARPPDDVLAPAGPGDLAYQKRLDETQWWSPERLLALQLRQLGSLVAHTWRTVPSQRARLASAGLEPDRPIDLDRWRRLAPLTRREIQRAGEALWSDAVPAAHGAMLTTTTSGSTGTPVTVRGTVFDATVGKEITLRHFLWHPYDFTGRLASIRRTHGQIYEYPHGRSVARWGDTATFPFATGPAAILSISASIGQQARWLRGQNPNYLLTYASNLHFLAVHCREQGIALPRLEHVISFGEALSAETRDECRRAWNVAAIDAYSAQEVGTIALQCPDSERYHVQAETIFVEVVNDSGKPCRPGETGRVLVTPLHNFAMPLLRYEIGDHAEVGEPCACGRGLATLDRVLGRERNALLVARSGERYWPAFGSRKLRELAPIVQHQLVQKTVTRIEARFVSERPLTPDEESSVRAHILAALPCRFELVFAYYDHIPHNRSGKFETFVCEVAD
jgi:phenylacetate-CoA ligase